MTATLDVLILTLNEERNIKDCIASVAGADRVLVVDSGSTDRTREVATAAGAVVIAHAFTDFASQHNFAVANATSDWVLHLDADERVPPALWTEIRDAIDRPAYDGFQIPRLNFVAGAPLRHGGWYPQYHLRLHRRAKATWSRNVHEAAHVDGRVGTLHEPMLHYGHPDLTTFIDKVNRYTSLDAENVEQSVILLGVLAVTDPFAYFLYKFLIQRGFQDGWRGLAAASLLSFYRLSTYLKAIERIARSRETARSGDEGV